MLKELTFSSEYEKRGTVTKAMLTVSSQRKNIRIHVKCDKSL